MFLDHAIIASRYFFPRRAPVNPPFPVTAADGSTLACWRREADSPFVLVHFHGNGEVVADYVPGWAELWGVDTLLAEYRGYGGSTGTPSLAAMLDDVDAIAASVDKPIVVFGRSVGSIYAIHLASRHPVRGVILESGIADVLQRVLLRVHPHEVGATAEELAAEAATHFDHCAKLEDLDAPVLVLHAEHDDLVTIDHGERLASWAPHGRLVRFPRGDHNSIFFANQAAYVAQVRGFLEELA